MYIRVLGCEAGASQPVKSSDITNTMREIKLKEIKIDTTIASLLNDYDGMKDILISINPKFKKLNNPILRRTVARVATVKQAAIIGGMPPIELLNKLRAAVGQDAIEQEQEEIKEQKLPDWFDKKEAASLNANELLDNNKNPLAEVGKAIKKLNSGEILKLSADFKPEPLIEEFKKKGYEVATKQLSKDSFVTKILKA